MITKEQWKEIVEDYNSSVGAMAALHALEVKYASMEHANVLLANEKMKLTVELEEAKKLTTKSSELAKANQALIARVDVMQESLDEKQRKIEYQDGHLRTLREAVSNRG